jgi:DNA invertase Pin-like site-specific DNA recombinase
VSAVPRPVTKLTAEQEELLQAAVAAAEKSRESTDEAWAAIRRAAAGGVPVDLACEETKFSRATYYRRYPKGPTSQG